MSATKHDLDPEFGNWLRRARMGLKMNLREFAKVCGLSQSTVTSFELSRRLEGAFYIDLFVRLADGLNMDLGHVLQRAGFDLGLDGAKLATLRRVEDAVEVFMEHEESVRRALAEAAQISDVVYTDDIVRGLAAFDLVVERMRRERMAPSAVKLEPIKSGPRLWSKEDVAFLQANPLLSHVEAGERLGRSADAVRVYRYQHLRSTNAG
jgi:transcriptional regulator with XRE-family HTH domain